MQHSQVRPLPPLKRTMISQKLKTGRQSSQLLGCCTLHQCTSPDFCLTKGRFIVPRKASSHRSPTSAAVALSVTFNTPSALLYVNISILLFALALALALAPALGVNGLGGQQHFEAFEDDHADCKLHKNHEINTFCEQ